MSAQLEERTDRFKLHSIGDLLGLPEPEWLIDSLFTCGSLVCLYGPSGHGKSFLALDWALSLALGTTWLGHPTRHGVVIYVAAEGGPSIRKRVQVWQQARGRVTVLEAFFILEAPQVREANQLDLLIRQIAEVETRPVLIVLDTLARCFVGGEENSAKDMGELVEGLDRLRRHTGATVMVLHHTGKDNLDMERGSTALRAGSDVMIRVVKGKDGLITVKNNKQKDDEEFDEIHLRLDPIELGATSTGRRVSSCILRRSDKSTPAEATMPTYLKAALRALSEQGGEATTRDWANKTGKRARTFYGHCSALLGMGCIERVARGRYRLTAQGRHFSTATATKVQSTDCSTSPSRSAATAPPPRGVAGAAKGTVPQGNGAPGTFGVRSDACGGRP